MLGGPIAPSESVPPSRYLHRGLDMTLGRGNEPKYEILQNAQVTVFTLGRGETEPARRDGGPADAAAKCGGAAAAHGHAAGAPGTVLGAELERTEHGYLESWTVACVHPCEY